MRLVTIPALLFLSRGPDASCVDSLWPATYIAPALLALIEKYIDGGKYGALGWQLFFLEIQHRAFSSGVLHRNSIVPLPASFDFVPTLIKFFLPSSFLIISQS
jgi:hypothetical protein